MEKSAITDFGQVRELSTPEERFNPFKWYRKMREEAPVRWDEERRTWDVFGYEEVKTVLDRKEVFSSRVFRDGKSLFENGLLNLDPPKHTQMRDIVNKAFTPKAMKDWEPRIQAITNELLDAVEGKQEIDLVEQLSYPLPVLVIAEMLGVPAKDQRKFKDWSDQAVAGPANNSEEAKSEQLRKQQQVVGELYAYFKEIIELKKKEPADDIISVLLQASVNGESLTEEEIVGFCILLLVAGNETTTNLITNAIYTFLEYPEVYRQIKNEPDELLPAAIEEVLRFRSPVQASFRFVQEDVVLGGKELRAGEYVIAWMGAANRDEKQFPNAEQFVVPRKPNLHMAFGRGIHFCLGAPLARMEAEIVLKEWIRRYPDFKLSAGFTLKPLESTFAYGIKELLLTV
ncbi:cytochrome P450 [Paenibacillus elgii]|uniref:Cytochrome P450 n=1 Tax=Paenibacillus elgii TaxID=189691 RepID=A0A2T6FZC2_9BACL|nr:cytochrome P450 [Paenibacillus elgii]MCM3271500.1 cytochrome P450 [Paenibacillus elgii]PUA37225.1 cytochrome P450 [Paenibacillus elgii]